ncbi:hypothetical protein BCR35DRAFT_299150 [Leucosporidium creatinivorum]|uniref:Uncharacterized protein n=1 Tax=Leucosporidium creatinivorum TaxID=106004 RepID=A0A1Y2G4B0_9BASI|nr:hypothetical protein BCR35DRAFT_299150 [Leucosporidium creatinivorum]
MSQVDSLWLRFNPYMTQRSYYTFLKGTYFDAIPILLATSPLWSSSCLPLRRLAFCQDLLPNHGVERKETPAFGLQEVSDALDDLTGSARSTPAEMQRERETRVSRRGDDDKMSFAQPIVFHRLHCLTVLSLSTLGANLTSLHLRLPRRSVLTALTAYPAPPSPFAPQPAPFPSLTLLDLSTTMVPAGDLKLPLMLRLMPRLEYLLLDRCSGLVGSREMGEETAKATLRWLGKVIAGLPSSRAEEAIRSWRRISKERPTFVAAPGPDGPSSGTPPPPSVIEKKKRAGRSGYASAPRPARATTTTPSAPPATWAQQQLQAPKLMIRDVQIFPPTPSLLSLSMGLFALPAEIHQMWSAEFKAGLKDSLEKTVVKMEEYLHRWEVWEREGKLEIPVSGAEGGGEGRRWGRKMVGFRREVERVRQEAGLPVVDELAHTGGAPGEEDEVFRRFLKSRDLVVITPSTGHLLLSTFKSLLATPLHSTPSSSASTSPFLSPTPTFSLCLTPDCSSSPGIAHLSLAAGQTNAVKESLEEREAREKGFAEQEERERREWRRPREEHVEGCGHLWSRDEWGEEF